MTLLLGSKPRRVASGLYVVDYGAMDFARASEGSYLTGAPGSGSSAFMSWASTDVLRSEDRGDGAGALALLEGYRINGIAQARAFENAYYSASGSEFTLTADYGPGPDGTTTATRVQGGTNGNRYKGSVGAGVLSAWFRAVSGTSNAQLSMDGTAARGIAGIGTTYQRLDVYGSPGTYALAVDTFDRSGAGGITALACDILVDLIQHEQSQHFPSSAIRTSGASGDREADELTLATGIPAALFTDPGAFSQWSPIMDSGDLQLSEQLWLLSIGGAGGLNEGIRVRRNGTDIRIEALEANTVVAQSQALTWSAHDLVGEVKWDPAAGLIYVDGVAGPSGTPWSWTADAIRVGGSYGGSDEAFSRLGTLGGV